MKLHPAEKGKRLWEELHHRGFRESRAPFSTQFQEPNSLLGPISDCLKFLPPLESSTRAVGQILSMLNIDVEPLGSHSRAREGSARTSEDCDSYCIGLLHNWLVLLYIESYISIYFSRFWDNWVKWHFTGNTSCKLSNLPRPFLLKGNAYNLNVLFLKAIWFKVFFISVLGLKESWQ